MGHHPRSPPRPSSKGHLGLQKKIATANPRPFVYRNRILHCDGADLTTLAEKYGTPLYVYSAEQITQRFQLFQQAFTHEARPHTICYAVKANSSLAILRLLAQQGAGFDIVSGGELERVRKAHKPALKKVVFSGVGKQLWEIDAALDADILLFNVESEAELHLLAARAEARSKIARFALRVNPDVFAETHPYISTGLSEHKFGIDIKAARAIYRTAKKSKWLDPAGDLTQTLTVFGTPGYIAPEQSEHAGAELTAATDIYSLGAILFELLSGRPPFLGEHALAVLRQAAENDAPKLRSIVPKASRDLETICARCLERDPNLRYASAAALAEDLDQWLEGCPIAARPISPPAPGSGSASVATPKVS